MKIVCIAGPDIGKVVTSTCGKLLEVCCQHPNQTSSSNCPKENYDYDYSGEDYEDDIFGSTDDDSSYEDTITYNDDEQDIEDDIFRTGPTSGSPIQCGKRNNNGLAQIADLKVSISK